MLKTDGITLSDAISNSIKHKGNYNFPLSSKTIA